MHGFAQRPSELDSSLRGSDLLPVEPFAEPASAALASSPEAILVASGAWVASGLVVALFMTRRGHDAGAWALLGIALGPLLLGLAAHWVRDLEPMTGPLVLARGADHGGSIHVVVGLPGVNPDLDGARSALNELGTALGRLTLACAIDFESLMDEEWDTAKTAAAMMLNRAEVALAPYEPELMILPGRIDQALHRFAGTGDFQRVLLLPDR